MVIDTSAVVAILFAEPEAGTLLQSIAADSLRLMSAASLLELAMIIEARRGEEGGAALDLWMYKAGVEIIAVDAEQVDIARRAWRKFGKGRHVAGLNFGDCFSYALAATRGEPLLFKGNDFSHTDIEAVSL